MHSPMSSSAFKPEYRQRIHPSARLVSRLLTTSTMDGTRPVFCNNCFRNVRVFCSPRLGSHCMSLHKLAKELDETARQSASMLEGIAEALEILSDSKLNKDASVRDAVQMIVIALQGQDRIEQRCHNLALATRQFALLPASTPQSVFDEIWSSLSLDELRLPALSGVAARQNHGEVDLF